MDVADKSITPSKPLRHGGRLWLPLIGLLVGFGVGWISGAARQPYSPVAEAKVCYAALTESNQTLQPQTREYLKARLYWDAAVEIRPGWLDGWHIDFGPVDDGALLGASRH